MQKTRTKISESEDGQWAIWKVTSDFKTDQSGAVSEEAKFQVCSNDDIQQFAPPPYVFRTLKEASTRIGTL